MRCCYCCCVGVFSSRCSKLLSFVLFLIFIHKNKSGCQKESECGSSYLHEREVLQTDLLHCLRSQSVSKSMDGMDSFRHTHKTERLVSGPDPAKKSMNNPPLFLSQELSDSLPAEDNPVLQGLVQIARGKLFSNRTLNKALRCLEPVLLLLLPKTFPSHIHC